MSALGRGDDARNPPEGRYANQFDVGHNAFEFLIDFAQSYHEDEDTLPHTRIVLSPPRAKALAVLLVEALERYESMFGRIDDR